MAIEFKKYTDWFHDGNLKLIDHQKKTGNIIITMSSAQIIGWEEFDGKIELSGYQTIAGKLHLEGVSFISINEEPCDYLQKLYEGGKILDFEISEDNVVELGISWSTATKHAIDFTTILVTAKKIWWENIPELDDNAHLC